MNTSAIVKTLKNFDTDYEFYPTSLDMLDVIKNDVREIIPLNKYDIEEGDDLYPNPTVLDVGAGDGRALEYLTTGKKYAVEKSRHLLGLMNKEIITVGTEFHETGFVDKAVDLVFCNPPYKQYDVWMEKLIKEVNARLLYMIVPKRWKDSKKIKDALTARSANAEVLKQTDFLSADRKAQAVVDIVRIDMAYITQYIEFGKSKKRISRKREEPVIDPFDLWFDDTFSFNDTSDLKHVSTSEQFLTNKVDNEIVKGKGLIENLVMFYNDDMDNLLKGYEAISKLDPNILIEISVDIDAIKEFIKIKIKGLKHTYWHNFFNNYSPITSRLTAKSRTKLLDKIHGNVNVDFTISNAFAITTWVIKNANQYFDDQLIEVYESMISEANIIRYKSNKRVFKDELHKYLYNHEKRHEAYGKIALNYRIVLEIGGLSPGDQFNGLAESSAVFIQDIMTIALNLGYKFDEKQDPLKGDEWTSGKMKTFYARKNGKDVIFMTVRAYLKGTVHFKLNVDFAKQLNVVHGELKGWVKDWKDIVREFDFDSKNKDSIVTKEEADQYMDQGNFKVLPSSISSLLISKEPSLDTNIGVVGLEHIAEYKESA